MTKLFCTETLLRLNDETDHDADDDDDDDKKEEDVDYDSSPPNFSA